MAKSETVTRHEIMTVQGNSYMSVYLDQKLDVDTCLTLQDSDEQIWKVIAVHETVTRKSIKRHWNNNI